MVYTLRMTTKTFWILVTGLWACMITVQFTLDGLPRVLSLAGITLVWLGLLVELRRNLRRSQRR